MRKFFFTAGILLYSLIVSSQECTIYKLKEKVLLNKKECECYVFKDDTINCRSENTREGKWINLFQYSYIELDSLEKNKYSEAKIFKYLISENFYFNDLKEGIQKKYAFPKLKTQQNFREQTLYSITNYNHGIKDSTEIIHHERKKRAYKTIICWNQGVAEEIQIFKNDSIKLIALMESRNQLNCFIYFDNNKTTYKWNKFSFPDVLNEENYIIQIDSCGKETTTFKKSITDIVPDQYYRLFIQAL